LLVPFFPPPPPPPEKHRTGQVKGFFLGTPSGGFLQLFSLLPFFVVSLFFFTIFPPSGCWWTVFETFFAPLKHWFPSFGEKPRVLSFFPAYPVFFFPHLSPFDFPHFLTSAFVFGPSLVRLAFWGDSAFEQKPPRFGFLPI